MHVLVPFYVVWDKSSRYHGLPKCTQSQGKESSMEDTKGLVVAVIQVLFEIDNFNITMELTLLIDVFYVNYPSLSPACIQFFAFCSRTSNRNKTQ